MEKDKEISDSCSVPSYNRRDFLSLAWWGSAGLLALIGVAALLTIGADGICSAARIALGAVAPTPVRATQTEKLLTGKKIDDNLVKKAAQTASDEASPIDDIRGSAEYRREMLKVFTRDAIKQAAEMAKSAA